MSETTERRHGWAPRFLRVAAAAVLAGAMSLTLVSAHAATTGSWAEWTPLEGATGAFTGTVTVAQTPALTATITSDSRGGGVGVISGGSTWLAQGTPVGAKYGTSRDQTYLNLRPRADSPSVASTTTYTFNRPTPRSGWTFVLGDIDADQVTIRAVGPGGTPLTAAELGFRSGFNYCAPGVAGKPSCAGDANDVPAWDAASRTLTGNAGAADTAGAAAWFEPTQPVSSLTLTFLRRAGLPIYQAWFASLARDITGTVTDINTGPADAVAVRLIDEYGSVVAETITNASGEYAFTGILATSGYTVEAVPPAGKTGTDLTRKAADLTTTDAVVPFGIRDIIPVAVSGTVLDTTGSPVPGATVTATGTGGTFTATTASDGTYLFDVVQVGTYTSAVAPPDGYTVSSQPAPFSVPAESEQPITGQDFVLAANPDLTGKVTAGGVGVAGVSIVVRGERTYTAVTGADGSYRVPRADPGDYEVLITPPDGYVAIGPVSREEAVSDADVTDVDFALFREGAIAGTVSAASGPVSGVTLVVDGPGGQQSLTTNDAGEYLSNGLVPGTYTVTVSPPDGYEVTGEAARTITISESGQVADASFSLAAVSLPPSPEPAPGSSVSPAPSPAPSQGSVPALPATGVDVSGSVLAAGLLLIAGLGVIVTSQRRRTR